MNLKEMAPGIARTALFASMILSKPEVASAQNSNPCTGDGTIIYCDDFRIRRPFADVGNVYDITPRVEDLDSLREWRQAASHGWTDGINYMGTQGCVITDLDDSYLRARRRVITASPCLPSIDNP